MALAFAAVALTATALSAGSAHADEMNSGNFNPFASAAPGGSNADAYGWIGGDAEMYRSDNGTTTVTVDIVGLEPGVKYPVHVHSQACANNEAGAHYKRNANGPSTPPNEIWPGPVTANRDGEAMGQTTVKYTAGNRARSVVVHAPSGAKLACADLAPEPGDSAA